MSRAILALILVGAACNRPEPPPAVHRAVSATVEHFNPGLAIGQPLSVAVTHIGPHRWVQHAGIVGKPRRVIFDAIRIYTDSAARAQGAMNPDAYVHAVELANDGRDDRIAVMSDLAIAFRGVPKQACLVSQDPEAPSYNVDYWTTPNDAGGAAVLTEWMGRPLAEGDRLHWSLFVWSGPLKNTETFLAPFSPGWCESGLDVPTPKSVEATVAAVDELRHAFSDSVRGGYRAQAAEVAQVQAAIDATDACMIPMASSPTSTFAGSGFTVDLPVDFTPDRSRPNTWRAPDGAEVNVSPGPSTLLPHSAGGGSTIKSHCANPINGQTADVDLSDLGYGTSRTGYLVMATFVGGGRRSLTFRGTARTNARRLELLRAAYSMQID